MRRRTKWAIAAGAVWTSFIFGLGLGAGGAGEVATPAASGPIVVVVPQSGASDGRTATITAAPVPPTGEATKAPQRPSQGQERATVVVTTKPAPQVLQDDGEISEDDPRWNCSTMGNRICGPGHEPSTITVALNK